MSTDWQVSEVGDTCRAAAGLVRRQSVQIEWLSAGTAHLGFPALLSVPHLLLREIIMNRRHCWMQKFWKSQFFLLRKNCLVEFECTAQFTPSSPSLIQHFHCNRLTKLLFFVRNGFRLTEEGHVRLKPFWTKAMQWKCWVRGRELVVNCVVHSNSTRCLSTSRWPEYNS